MTTTSAGHAGVPAASDRVRDLVARMTRGTWHVTDVSNASRTLLCDIASRTWDGELLDLFGVPERKDAVGSEAWKESGIVQKAIRAIKRELAESFGLEHATVEIEYGSCADRPASPQEAA